MLSLPFLKEKVDTINHCLQELACLNKEINLDQKQIKRYSLMNSAFIQFNTQAAAYMTCNSSIQCMFLSLKPHNLKASAEDIKWDNLFQKWWSCYLCILLVIGFIATLILAWSIPVTLISLMSQITYLTAAVS